MLEEKISQVLDLVIEGAKAGATLAQEQAPLVLKEYIYYLMLEQFPTASLIFLVLGILVFRYLYKYTPMKLKRQQSEYEDDYHARGFVTIGGCIVSVIAVCISLSNIISSVQSIAQLYFAPKVYIIKDVASTLKSKPCAGDKQ